MSGGGRLIGRLDLVLCIRTTHLETKSLGWLRDKSSTNTENKQIGSGKGQTGAHSPETHQAQGEARMQLLLQKQV